MDNKGERNSGYVTLGDQIVAEIIHISWTITRPMVIWDIFGDVTPETLRRTTRLNGISGKVITNKRIPEWDDLCSLLDGVLITKVDLVGRTLDINEYTWIARNFELV